MLACKNINKQYDGRSTLKDVSLTLERGEILALIGPSGAGKTTLIKNLSLLEYPDSGEITIDNDTYSFPGDSEKKITPWPKISVVFQQLFLWPHLTLKDNILLPVRLKNKKDIDKKFEELISLFDMGDFINRYPNQASLGQRQRAAIVRALMLEPEYLFLDEITSSLDVEQINIIISHLQKLKQNNIGIIMITHLLGFARKSADKVVFIDNGQIIESGGAEVINKPKSDRVKKFISDINNIY